MNINKIKNMFINKGDKMKLFKETKSNKYIENMTIGAKTQLSLLETLNALQHEYEEYHLSTTAEIELLKKENQALKAMIEKIKSNK